MEKKQIEDFGAMKSDISWLKNNNITLSESIKSLHVKMDNFIDSTPKEARVSSIEKKVGQLMCWKWYVTGGFLGVIGFLGWILNYILR